MTDLLKSRDNHHTWWRKKDFNSDPLLRELRERYIVPVLRTGHVALHACMDPPPIPEEWMAAELLDATSLENPERGIESVEFAVDWFTTNAIRQYHNNQKHMLETAHHLRKQLTFMRAGNERA